MQSLMQTQLWPALKIVNGKCKFVYYKMDMQKVEQTRSLFFKHPIYALTNYYFLIEKCGTPEFAIGNVKMKVKYAWWTLPAKFSNSLYLYRVDLNKAKQYKNKYPKEHIPQGQLCDVAGELFYKARNIQFKNPNKNEPNTTPTVNIKLSDGNINACLSKQPGSKIGGRETNSSSTKKSWWQRLYSSITRTS